MAPVTPEAAQAAPPSPGPGRGLQALNQDWGRTSRSRRLARGLLGNAAARLGAGLLLAFAVVALAAPVLAPCPQERLRYCGEDPFRIPRYGFSNQPQPPSAEHPFGTTPKQYDIYYGVVWGARTAFKVGLLVTIPALLFGVFVGTVAGYRGGWTDEVVMRAVEIFMAFPFFIAAAALAAVLRTRPGFTDSPYPAILALLAFGWMGYARLIRADVLSVKVREYVWAARALGVSDGHIMLRHVVPNAMFPALIMAATEVGTYVLTFAALSFFGLGLPDGYADWGQMLSSARNRVPTLAQDWYIVAFPGLALILFALAWTLVGDAVRDVLDPRLGGKRA